MTKTLVKKVTLTRLQIVKLYNFIKEKRDFFESKTDTYKALTPMVSEELGFPISDVSLGQACRDLGITRRVLTTKKDDCTAEIAVLKKKLNILLEAVTVIYSQFDIALPECISKWEN